MQRMALCSNSSRRCSVDKRNTSETNSNPGSGDTENTANSSSPTNLNGAGSNLTK